MDERYRPKGFWLSVIASTAKDIWANNKISIVIAVLSAAAVLLVKP